jgi:hypothetical protein
MTNQNFTKNILWDGAHRFCKLYEKKDKNGATYFMGEMNRNCQLTMRKTTGQYAKDGEWEVQVIPIKYTKNDGQNSGQNFGQNFGQQNAQMAQKVFNAEPQGAVTNFDGDEAPF